MKSLREQPLVLVVDDDAGQRLLTSAALLPGGFAVLEAADGERALSLYQRERPDLVLLDVVMPGLDGFAVCEALRRLPGGRHLPIVMVTALDDLQSVERAYQAGATDFITKPIQWTILRHRVRYILRASQALLELRESEERFRTLVRAAGSVILVLSRDWRVLEFNPAAERFYSFQRGEPAGPDFLASLPCAGDRSGRESSWSGEGALQALDGGEHALLWNISPFADAEGALAGWVVVGQDITARRRAEQNMRKLSYAVEQNPISILITDTDGVIEYANRKFVEVSRYALEELVGKTPDFLQTSTLTTEEYQRLQRTLAGGDIWQGELCTRHKDGELLWESALVSGIRDERGVVTHFVWLREDITTRKQAEERIRFLAYYDHLTQLPNRVLLQERLLDAVELAKVRSQALAVLFLDLDQFKRVNDSLGHRAGDLLLQQVAIRLQDCLRSADYVCNALPDLLAPQDILARLGGDEFVILLAEISHPDAVVKVAQRILSVIAQPFTLEGNEVFSGCSIGIALYPYDGDDMETLLKNADTALYHAKNAGRNNYQLFSDWMHVATIQHVEMEGLLRKALDRQELTLHYQPQVDIGSGRIVGVEALLRWQNPELGSVAPADFIPLAEETGLIIPIGEWVIRAACTQARAWQNMGLPPLRMAVNLSPRQFVDAELSTLVADVLEETGLRPDLLELEITESLLMKEDAIDTLHALKRLGVRLAIDDFGTGYSNLGYLRRFPIDRLKIDKSFVRDIKGVNDDAAIAAAVIAMARCLRMDVIAEGVETETQLMFLREMNCDEMQGFFFSRPCPAEHITALLCGHLTLGKWAGVEQDDLPGGNHGQIQRHRYSRVSVFNPFH